MLAHHVNASGRIWNAIADGFPVLAIVVRRKNIDVVIAAPMAVEREKRGAVAGLRRNHTAHVGSLRHSRCLRCDVFPSLASVASYLYIAVIGAYPQHVGRKRRLTQRCDGRIFLHAVVAREGDRKSTRLNSSHITISYAVFCLKKKTQ